MKPITLSDSTLRDGNHAASQGLDFKHLGPLMEALDATGIEWIEVGHGNGLGASSLNFGRSPNSDREIIESAVRSINSAKVSVHAMPGIATFLDDVAPAMDLGVQVVRVASHCTEADTTLNMLEKVSDHGGIAVGVLMMVHRVSPTELAEQAADMYKAGAATVMIMDSAGSLNKDSTAERVASLLELEMGAVGFHAHNNLGLAVSNSLQAIVSGATVIDGTCMGFGAGAGNASMELIIANLHQIGASSAASLQNYLYLVEHVASKFDISSPDLSPLSIVTGTKGIFSGFARQIRQAAFENQVSWLDLCEELGRYETVAGQEDLIFEIAATMARNNVKRSD